MIVLGIGATAFTVLWWRYGGAGPGVELDAVRTAGALMAGAGGAIALLLAARRQRSTELTLEHQREVARATERNAAEQRITELYTRAVEQLGAEKAPVRLGGLHALERLAQNNPTQRQTIVDVICAYLRMPYTPPDDLEPGEDAPADARIRQEQRRQELQVRLTAERILSAHLKPEATPAFWGDIDLNLTEAHLRQLDLTTCHIRKAQFYRATFAGNAGFHRATFAGDALFDGATFAGYALFDEATFAKTAGFGWVKFAETAVFGGAKFTGPARFSKAMFAGKTWFGEAEFTGDTKFDGATFAGDTVFGAAAFTRNTEFDGTRVTPSSPRVVLPMGWITRAAQPAEGEEEGWLYVVRDEGSSKQLAEAPVDPQATDNDPPTGSS